MSVRVSECWGDREVVKEAAETVDVDSRKGRGVRRVVLSSAGVCRRSCFSFFFFSKVTVVLMASPQATRSLSRFSGLGVVTTTERSAGVGWREGSGARGIPLPHSCGKTKRSTTNKQKQLACAWPQSHNMLYLSGTPSDLQPESILQLQI